jgi:hypothetical protein
MRSDPQIVASDRLALRFQLRAMFFVPFIHGPMLPISKVDKSRLLPK